MHPVILAAAATTEVMEIPCESVCDQGVGVLLGALLLMLSQGRCVLRRMCLSPQCPHSRFPRHPYMDHRATPPEPQGFESAQAVKALSAPCALCAAKERCTGFAFLLHTCLPPPTQSKAKQPTQPIFHAARIAHNAQSSPPPSHGFHFLADYVLLSRASACC